MSMAYGDGVHLENAVFDRFAGLSCGGKIMAEYVWIGGTPVDSGLQARMCVFPDLRSKTMILDEKPRNVSELRVWNFDGSSTNQAPGENSEVHIRPVAIYPDPFRGGDHILVMCECLHTNGDTPTWNTRGPCAEVMEKAKEHEPWFGLEQEYTLFEPDRTTPLHWPAKGCPRPQGPYYCGSGVNSALGRMVAEAHLRCCLFAGLTISGINAEVMPSQWEYQIGPVRGIDGGDQMWIGRYLMLRVCEQFGVNVSFDPKPMAGDWNGAGCHCNYSTKAMRTVEGGGMTTMLAAVKKLGEKHVEHMAAYGEGNERRMTGLHETASMDTFSAGVADRGASIRIPFDCDKAGCGYIEDRRPSANMDPYVVTGMIVETTCL